MTIRTWRGEFISAEEVCDRTFLDLTTVYEMALRNEIPGAEWGETLRFKLDEFQKWWESELEDILRELEEDGLITSYVDSEGQRRYWVTPTKKTSLKRNL